VQLGKMADSNFWQDMAGRFLAITNGSWLNVRWRSIKKIDSPDPLITKWTIAVTFPEAKSARLEFEAIARRCGREVYPYCDSLDGWFQELRSATKTKPPAVSRQFDSNGRVAAHVNDGVISNPCQASADLCRALESLAIEAERKEAERKEREDRSKPLDHDLPKHDTSHDVSNVMVKRQKRPKTEPLKVQLAHLRKDCKLTVDQLAEAIDIETRSVYRHLRGTIPRDEQLRAYERVFTEKLGQPITLTTTPKRQ
jgi:hypothetical protein